MSDAREADGLEQDPCRDEVVMEHNADNGVRVDAVHRSGYDEDTTVLKVYGTRRDTYSSLDPDKGTNRVQRQVKIAEMPESVGYETLVGLAEAYGYRLEPR